MGLCVRVTEEEFCIKRKHQAKAFDAVMRFTRRRHDPGFVKHGDCDECENLMDFFEVWGWDPTVDEKGNIVGITLDQEKISDDFKMFASIAPWVKDGSYIQMVWEGDESWRWVFKDNCCHEISPIISWPEVES